jgi:hypothetical protein
MFERMLAGVSTRRYARTGEPVGEEIDAAARSTSKSAVSREFVSRTREHLIELMSRPLGDLRAGQDDREDLAQVHDAPPSASRTTPSASARIRSRCSSPRRLSA